MYEVLSMLYMMLFQIRMNGLEAASIMRKELKYTGAIIGMLYSSLLRTAANIDNAKFSPKNRCYRQCTPR